MRIVYWILSIILCALLYRFGGIGRPFNTKHRDFGCPTIAGLSVWFLLDIHGAWWVHLICFLLLFAALTTYWDFLFGFDNHWFHGFMCGVAYIPLAFIDGEWVLWIVRAFALAICMGAWSVIFSNDWVEELGRGAFIPLTLLILLV